MLTSRRTLRCPACGQGNVHAPAHWLDFAHWVSGAPTAVPCQRCGQPIPLVNHRVGTLIGLLLILGPVVVLGLVLVYLAVRRWC